ncbi:MAG: hypothetical protein KDD85_02940 [Parvularculaceae bacterium]|nr:hypothetical protein [Parvularculaceae bacterium]
MNTPALSAKIPWHFWAVGVFALLWNGFGCFDYFMTNTVGDEYMRNVGMTADQIAYFNAKPTWLTAVWAVGVWGGLAGAILLLIRSKWAVEVFIVSFLAYVVSLIDAHLLDPMESGGGDMIGMQIVIFVLCIFFIWYSKRARKGGQLR